MWVDALLLLLTLMALGSALVVGIYTWAEPSTWFFVWLALAAATSTVLYHAVGTWRAVWFGTVAPGLVLAVWLIAVQCAMDGNEMQKKKKQA